MAKEELTWEKVEEMFKNNEQLVQAINAAKSEEEANAVLKAHGIEATVEEIKEAVAERPLTDEELEKVAGGACVCIIIGLSGVEAEEAHACAYMGIGFGLPSYG